MIWEQGCIVIVNLTRLSENGVSVCHRYWPEEGSDLYHIYEVRLIALIQCVLYSSIFVIGSSNVCRCMIGGMRWIGEDHHSPLFGQHQFSA